MIAMLCLGACGDDGDSSSDGAAGSKAKAGAGASTGGNKAGTSGGAGTSGTATPEPVACGSKKCTAPANPFAALLGGAMMGGMAPIPGLGTAVACCLDARSETCGTAPSADAACEPPAMPDSRCPALSIGALAGSGFGNSSGCCIDNACGQDGALFGRGCVENTALKEMLSGSPFGGFLMLPASRACDAPPAEDAGVEDAGS